MTIQEIYSKAESLQPKILVNLEVSSTGVVVNLSKWDGKYETKTSFWVDQCRDFDRIFNNELEKFNKHGN